MDMDIKKDLKEIGKKLKQIRGRGGLTQAEVAKKAGITANYYARIERGEENPSFEVIKGLTFALKVKSSDILPF